MRYTHKKEKPTAKTQNRTRFRNSSDAGIVRRIYVEPLVGKINNTREKAEFRPRWRLWEGTYGNAGNETRVIREAHPPQAHRKTHGRKGKHGKLQEKAA